MKNRKLTSDWVLIGLVSGFFMVMIPLSMVDFEWTLYLHANQHEFLGEFMRRTLFEGGKFGASDPAIVFVLFVMFAYFRNNPQEQIDQFGFFRPQLGFLVVSALITGLGLVHSIKYIVGRARPDQVLKHSYPYSQWFEFGPQFVADGIFYGSFPSGHTAAVFMLMTLSYILIFDPTKPRKAKIAGWMWGGLILTMTSLMIIARSMTLHHWLSDSIGITFLCWITTHLLFFYIFKIPEQMEYLQRHRAYPSLPRYWEFQILWRILILALCIMCIIIGLRAVWVQRIPYLVLASIPALILFYFVGKNLKVVYQASMNRFLSPDQIK